MFRTIRNNLRNKKYLKHLLDSENEKYWHQLIQTENIRITEGNFPSYSVYSIVNKHQIFIPNNDFNPAAFSHELLHIYLSTKNVHIGGALTLSTYADNNLRKIFSQDLLNNISNNLAHIKMLPLFLKMGYERENFIGDYFTNKGLNENFNDVERYFRFEHQGRIIYLDRAVDCYIGFYRMP